MAGPAASVLLREALHGAQVTDVRTQIADLADEVKGDDFWLDGRPFFVMFKEDYPGALDDLAKEGLPMVLGWTPIGVLGFAAMCNDDLDHRLLAALCLRFAKNLDGLIDFGGTVAAGPNVSASSAAPPARIERPQGLLGVLFATTYMTHEGLYATCHYADVVFMESWLDDPRFRMVK